MKKIKQLNFNDLIFIRSLIDEEQKDFTNFNKLGWNFKNLLSHFKKKYNYSVGYFYNNKLCGILIGEKLINNKDFDLEIHIMFVIKKRRRNKIGSSILNFVQLKKNNSKISKIYLEVAENNFEAIKFYEKNNFVYFNFRHNFYKYNNNMINGKCYYKII